MNFTKIPVGNPQRELVYSQLRQAILEGTIVPGEKLVETSYADTFGVSRTPVREAIRMLERDGLVDYIPKRGAFARKRLSRDEVDELYTVRSILQVASADGIIENILPTEIEAMRHANEMCRKALETRDSAVFFDNLDEFHRLQTETCRKTLLIRLLNQVEIYKPEMAFMNKDRAEKRILDDSNLERYTNTVNEHEQILAGIAAKDAEMLRKAVGDHSMAMRDIGLAAYDAQV